ncbi:MAG: hypothetical protein ACM30G_20830 [Micromonosporaceae bacterium]
MFAETVTVPAREWHAWTTRLRLLTEPPAALVGSIAWRVADGSVMHVNVWDSPAAVADFYLERVEPLIMADGPPSAKPVRHGEPVAVYLRGPMTSVADDS